MSRDVIVAVAIVLFSAAVQQALAQAPATGENVVAARGLATRPRATFNRAALARVLALKESQRVLLNLPVGYPVR